MASNRLHDSAPDAPSRSQHPVGHDVRGVDHSVDVSTEELLSLFAGLQLPRPNWLSLEGVTDEASLRHVLHAGAASLRDRALIVENGDGPPQISPALATAIRTAGHPAVVSRIIASGAELTSTYVFSTSDFTVAIGGTGDGQQRIRMVPVDHTLALLVDLADLPPTDGSGDRRAGDSSAEHDSPPTIGPLPASALDHVAELVDHEPADRVAVLTGAGLDQFDAEAFAEIFAPTSVVHSVMTSYPTGAVTTADTVATWVAPGDGTVHLIDRAGDEIVFTETTSDAIAATIADGYPS